MIVEIRFELGGIPGQLSGIPFQRGPRREHPVFLECECCVEVQYHSREWQAD